MLKLVTVAGRQHVNLLGAPAKFSGYQPQRFIGLMFQHWFDRTFNRVGTLQLYKLMSYETHLVKFSASLYKSYSILCYFLLELNRL